MSPLHARGRRLNGYPAGADEHAQRQDTDPLTDRGSSVFRDDAAACGHARGGTHRSHQPPGRRRGCARMRAPPALPRKTPARHTPPPPRRHNSAPVLRGCAPKPTRRRGGKTRRFQQRSATGSRRSRGDGCGPVRAQEWLRSEPASGWSTTATGRRITGRIQPMTLGASTSPDSTTRKATSRSKPRRKPLARRLPVRHRFREGSDS